MQRGSTARQRDYGVQFKKVKSTTLCEEWQWGAHVPYLGLEPVGG